MGDIELGITPVREVVQAKGTQDAAFATGAAPITLIDGEKVDLLIEHGIGVRKRTIALLEVDTETFTPEED